MTRLAFLACLLLAPFVLAAETRPNVIVVMTDDHGYGDFGIHGNPHIRTPTLDSFARDGVQFSRFYVSPVCSPTRASLLTGRYHYRTGILHTSRGAAKMHGEEVTVAERLTAAGYRTGIFGKWHLGDNYPMRPSDQGFGEALIHKSGAIGMQSDGPSSYFDPRLWHNNQPLPTKGYCTDVFFEAALRFIEANRDRPFFVYLPTNAPHTPLDVPARYVERYKAPGLDDTTARVYGMVENIDENFARLLTRLETWFDDVRRSRGFAPGIIHLGSEREPSAHLSRYQDGGYPGGASTGWRVKVLKAGRHEVTFLRGEHRGPVNLVVQWNGRTEKQPLAAGADTASSKLTTGDGMSDIWSESPAGARLAFTGNERDGDAILRKL